MKSADGKDRANAVRQATVQTAGQTTAQTTGRKAVQTTGQTTARSITRTAASLSGPALRPGPARHTVERLSGPASAPRRRRFPPLRKLCSWALVFAMLLSLLPANTAFAAPGDPPTSASGEPPIGVQYTIVRTAAELKTALEGPNLYVKLGGDITVPAHYNYFSTMNPSKNGAFILDGGGCKLVFLGGHYPSTGHIKVDDVKNMPSLTVRNITVHSAHQQGFLSGAYKGTMNFKDMTFIGPAVSNLTSTASTVKQNIINCDITIAIRYNNTQDVYVHVGNDYLMPVQRATANGSGAAAAADYLSIQRTAPAFSSRNIEFFGAGNRIFKPHTSNTGYHKIFYLAHNSAGAVFRVAEGAVLDIEDQSYSLQETYPNGLFNSANNRSVVTVAKGAKFTYKSTGKYGGVIVRGNTANHYLANFVIEEDATVDFRLKAPGAHEVWYNNYSTLKSVKVSVGARATWNYTLSGGESKYLINERANLLRTNNLTLGAKSNVNIAFLNNGSVAKGRSAVSFYGSTPTLTINDPKNFLAYNGSYAKSGVNGYAIESENDLIFRLAGKQFATWDKGTPNLSLNTDTWTVSPEPKDAPANAKVWGVKSPFPYKDEYNYSSFIFLTTLKKANTDTKATSTSMQFYTNGSNYERGALPHGRYVWPADMAAYIKDNTTTNNPAFPIPAPLTDANFEDPLGLQNTKLMNKTVFQVRSGDEHLAVSDKPTIEPVKAGDAQIKGTGINGSVVTVTIFPNLPTTESQDGEGDDGEGNDNDSENDFETYTAATTVQFGKWSFDVSAIKAGYTLKAGENIEAVQQEQTTPPKLMSDPVTTKVTPADEEVLKSDTPYISQVFTTDTEVRGTGSAGAQVSVLFEGDPDPVQATVNGDDTWTARVPVSLAPLETGKRVTAAQKEPGYETSASAVVYVYQRSPLPTINGPVYVGDQYISGTGADGSAITLTIGGDILDKAAFPITWVGAGAWTTPDISAEYALDVGQSISATQLLLTQPALADYTLESGAVQTVVMPQGGIDPSQSDTPTIGAVNTGDTEITGTGVSGSGVVVTFPDRVTVSSPASVGQDGIWRVSAGGASLPAGGVVTAVQTTAGKTASEPAHETVGGGDKTGGGNDGKSDTPDIDMIYAHDRFVSGVGTPNSSITALFLELGQTDTTSVDADGNWSVPVPEGGRLLFSNKVFANQLTPGKNLSAMAQKTVLARVDTDGVPSDTPSVNPIAAGSREISGTGGPGAEVMATFPDGGGSREVTVLADEDGNWRITVPDGIALTEGDNVFVEQTTPGHETSERAQETVGGGGATGTGTGPGGNNNGISDTPDVNTVYAHDRRVTGANAAPGSTISVRFADGSAASAVVSMYGTWVVRVPMNVGLKVGDKVYAAQTTPGKAVSRESQKTVVPFDTTDGKEPSDTPAVDPINPGDGRAAGSGEPGAEIVVKLPDGTEITTEVGEDGEWSIDFPAAYLPLMPGDVVEVTQTTPGKAPSDPAQETVGGGG
ncbi:MAG: hypothetical protein LBU58_08635, partial [Clostridiales bacterium]|nr:hypothetical protein [Clostridiales bacterium]